MYLSLANLIRWQVSMQCNVAFVRTGSRLKNPSRMAGAASVWHCIHGPPLIGLLSARVGTFEVPAMPATSETLSTLARQPVFGELIQRSITAMLHCYRLDSR